MFYYLLLAHVIGDYPLQPTWLIQEKKRLRGLLIHSGIHFFTLVIVVGFTRFDLWPILFILATVHLGIDFIKQAYSNRYPDHITGPYLVDQAVHLITLVVFAWLIESTNPNPISRISKDVLLIAIVSIGVTFVWGISERIFVHKKSAYLVELNLHFYGRMISRLGMLALLAILFVNPSNLKITPLLTIPYINSFFWRRALATDIAVSLVATVFLFILI